MGGGGSLMGSCITSAAAALQRLSGAAIGPACSVSIPHRCARIWSRCRMSSLEKPDVGHTLRRWQGTSQLPRPCFGNLSRPCSAGGLV